MDTTSVCVHTDCFCTAFSTSAGGEKVCGTCGHKKKKHTSGQQTPKNVTSIIQNTLEERFGGNGIRELAAFKDAERETRVGLRGKPRTDKGMVCH
jgi:uncharacterized ParB-like nuclease family protein